MLSPLPNIAIVILNYNGKPWLEKFLPSVLAHSQEASIYVIDNASTDASSQAIPKLFPDIRWIQLSENKGYTGGYNEGLAQINADYYVLLNSDVEVSAHWLQPMIELFAGHPQAAAAQPKILSFKYPDSFEYAGASGGFIDKLGFPFCRGRIFHEAERDNGQYNQAREVFWASGACLFIRAGLFHEIHGFDGDFFAHMEEIDLCWRLKNQGYSVWVLPNSVVYHVGGGTLNAANSLKTYLNFRNNLELMLKNLESKFLWRTLLMRLSLDGIAALRFLIDGGFKHFWAVFRAHMHFYVHMPRILKKRKRLKKEVRKRNTAGVYRSSVVIDFFIRGRKTFQQLPSKYFD